ncbi:MAG TPA: hypothetical protein VGR78_06065 [Verrucomicrobiae bacterium]|jgi:hypothetical protein|nr:hypothetical protein [Verrucomicrobiae bacterium]
MNTEIHVQRHNNQTSDTNPETPPASPPAVRSGQFAADRATRKARAGSFFGRLTEEQKLQLAIWFAENKTLIEIQRLAALPPPEGFGIQTHLTTLSRLRASNDALPAISRIGELLDSLDDIEAATDLDQLGRIQRVISHLLHERAFYLASNKAESKSLARLLTSIERLSALEHKRQKIVLEREKLTNQSPRRHQVELNIVRPPLASSESVNPACEDPSRHDQKAGQPSEPTATNPTHSLPIRSELPTIGSSRTSP